MNFDEVINRRGTYSTQWDFIEDRFGVGTKDIIPFSISDMDFKVPKEIEIALQKRVRHGIFGYSRWNHTEYKSSIVNWYKKRYKTDILDEWIVYCPNVIYSLSALLRILIKNGERIMIHTPKYDGFSKILEEYNIVEIPLVEIENGKFETDFAKIEDEFKNGVKIFILCNPDNPTGKVWSFLELKELIKLSLKYNVLLISDDIHMDIARVEVTPILKIETKNMIILSSSSKSFNTASLGGAYAIIPDIELRERFLYNLKNKDSLSSPSIFGIISTIVAYNECEYWLDELNRYLTRNCQFVKDELNGYKSIRAYIPEGTYLMWIDFKECGVDMDSLKRVLITVGKVGIMSGENYGDKNRLRLNVGAPFEKIKLGVEAIKKSIDFLKG